MHPSCKLLDSSTQAGLGLGFLLVLLQQIGGLQDSFHLEAVVWAAALPDDVGGVKELGGIVPVAVPLPQGYAGVVEGEGAMAEGWLPESRPCWLAG